MPPLGFEVFIPQAKAAELLLLEKQRDLLVAQVNDLMTKALAAGDAEPRGGARSKTAVYYAPGQPEDSMTAAWLSRSYDSGPVYLYTQLFSFDLEPLGLPIIHVGLSKEGKAYTDAYPDLSLEQTIELWTNIQETVGLISVTKQNPEARLKKVEEVPTEPTQVVKPESVPRNPRTAVRSRPQPRAKPAQARPVRDTVRPAPTTKKEVADDIERTSARRTESERTASRLTEGREQESKFETSLRNFLNGMSEDIPEIRTSLEVIQAERMVQEGSFSGDPNLREEVRDRINTYHRSKRRT